MAGGIAVKPLGNLNWLVVGVITVLVSGLILGSNWLYQRSAVSGPLLDSLSESPGVASAQLDTDGGVWVVKVSLDRVDSWARLHKDLYQRADEVLGERAYRIKTVDGRDADLEEVLLEASLDLHEAVATGHYTLLKETQERLKSDARVDLARVSVQDGWLLLQLENSRGYLYHQIAQRDAD